MNTNQHKDMIKSYAVNEIIRKYTSARIRERTGQEVEIEVPLQISKSKGALWILVVLPDEYPQVRPIIQIINAQVTHKYIDDNFGVTHPVLENWDRHCSLIDAITQINQSFDKSPPQLRKGTSAKVPGGSSMTKKIKLTNPELRDFDKKMKDLSPEEIESILNDESFFTDFFLQLDGVEDF
jgi:hypothetical protein